MPEFVVCAKSEVKKVVKSFEATHLLSTLDVGDRVFRPLSIHPRDHLQMNFGDEENEKAWDRPTFEHAQIIWDWSQQLPSDARVCVHCFAGVSRSTAVALALWLQHNGTDKLTEAHDWLVSIRARACPNMLLAKHFDQLLNLNGEFENLCDKIGADSVARWWKING